MTRPISFALFTMLVITVVSLVTMFLSVAGRFPDVTASLVYSSDAVTSARSSICPGEPLTFSVTSTIKSAPARVSTYVSIWDANARRTVYRDGVPTDNLIFLTQDIGRTISTTVVFSDTGAMVPGRYEYRRFAQSLGREPATFYVPFTIMDCK